MEDTKLKVYTSKLQISSLTITLAPPFLKYASLSISLLTTLNPLGYIRIYKSTKLHNPHPYSYSLDYTFASIYIDYKSPKCHLMHLDNRIQIAKLMGPILGPTWVLSAPNGPHIVPRTLLLGISFEFQLATWPQDSLDVLCSPAIVVGQRFSW